MPTDMTSDSRTVRFLLSLLFPPRTLHFHWLAEVGEGRLYAHQSPWWQTGTARLHAPLSHGRLTELAYFVSLSPPFPCVLALLSVSGAAVFSTTGHC